MIRRLLVLACLLVMGSAPQWVAAQTSAPKQDAAQPISFKIADDQISMTASGTWKKVTPKSNIIEVEFAIPKVGQDSADGRMTIMSSGGSVEANLDRWKGQFKNTDDDKLKVEKKTVNGLTVHVVDFSGTYIDSMGGPAGPKTDRDNYRMLAAIIETTESGLYFVKFYGPQATVAENEPHFQSLLNSLKETK